MTKTEIMEKLEFHKAALAQLREAYLAIAEGGVLSYTIGSRTLMRIDLTKVRAEIKEHEKAVDELTAALSGRKRRRAFGIVARDW